MAQSGSSQPLTAESFAAASAGDEVFVAAMLREESRPLIQELGRGEPWLVSFHPHTSYVKSTFADGGYPQCESLYYCRQGVVVYWQFILDMNFGFAVEPNAQGPMTRERHAAVLTETRALDLQAALAQARAWQGEAPPPDQVAVALAGTYEKVGHSEYTLEVGAKGTISEDYYRSGFNGVDERSTRGTWRLRADGNLDVVWNQHSSRQEVGWDHDGGETSNIERRTLLQVGWQQDRVEIRFSAGTVNWLSPSTVRYVRKLNK